MRAEIKSIDIIGHGDWSYWPDDMEKFCIAVQVILSPENEVAGESFQFHACSPKWFAENKVSHPTFATSPIFARHILFMNEYDEEELKKSVSALVEKTIGESWHEIAEKLSRYMHWEFEDYQPYIPKSKRG
jgi:hypothetical protein